MPFFATAAEVDCYVGGALRLAAVDPYLGPALAGAALTVRFACTDLPVQITVDMYDPMTVTCNDTRFNPDVELSCSADFLDHYMRGERRLVDALADGDVVAHGRVSKVLKIVPILEQAFPYYRQLVAVTKLTACPKSGAFL